MKIAFFGTPEFCVPSLEALIQNTRYSVVCVVTQPDRPGKRGKDLIPPPAKVLAQKRGIPVFQPERISKEIDTLFSTIEKPDIIVTCAFGQILRQNVIDYCKHGVVNVHASILPKYRGACPINFVIIKGETETGITIMQTDIGIDTGDILLQVPTKIGEDETAGELSARLSVIGADALVKTLDLIKSGKVKRTKQDDSKSSYYPMLKKSDGKIDFSKTPKEIVNFVRGMNPWPMAFAESNLGDIRVHKASVKYGELQLDIVQKPGGKPITYKDFLNGHKDFKLG
ncbi:MAG: methionyl-tRNA formyltransferase [Firmicutes bacterium]|nr:methionyl-tRNA formyltransferase [Bacillota bacterium]